MHNQQTSASAHLDPPAPICACLPACPSPALSRRVYTATYAHGECREQHFESHEREWAVRGMRSVDSSRWRHAHSGAARGQQMHIILTTELCPPPGTLQREEFCRRSL